MRDKLRRAYYRVVDWLEEHVFEAVHLLGVAGVVFMPLLLVAAMLYAFWRMD